MSEGQNPRFLNSEVPLPEDPLGGLRALSRQGDAAYVGLETFDNPGCAQVTFSGDELVAHCPVTGQPDFYEFRIDMLGIDKSIESKSLKIWMRQFADKDGPGLFCESLAVYIHRALADVLELDEDEAAQQLQVTLVQKSRGGISIKAIA